MAEPYEASSPESSEAGTREQGLLVRGADGALYLLTEEDLQAFRLTEEKAQKITDVLNNAPEDVVLRELSPNVIREVRSIAKGSSCTLQVSLRRKF